MATASWRIRDKQDQSNVAPSIVWLAWFQEEDQKNYCWLGTLHRTDLRDFATLIVLTTTQIG